MSQIEHTKAEKEPPSSPSSKVEVIHGANEEFARIASSPLSDEAKHKEIFKILPKYAAHLSADLEKASQEASTKYEQGNFNRTDLDRLTQAFLGEGLFLNFDVRPGLQKMFVPITGSLVLPECPSGVTAVFGRSYPAPRVTTFDEPSFHLVGKYAGETILVNTAKVFPENVSRLIPDSWRSGMRDATNGLVSHEYAHKILRERYGLDSEKAGSWQAKQAALYGRLSISHNLQVSEFIASSAGIIESPVEQARRLDQTLNHLRKNETGDFYSDLRDDPYGLVNSYVLQSLTTHLGNRGVSLSDILENYSQELEELNKLGLEKKASGQDYSDVIESIDQLKETAVREIMGAMTPEVFNFVKDDLLQASQQLIQAIPSLGR